MSTTTPEISTMADNPFAPDPDMKVWVGGQLLPAAEAAINVFDHGLLYGDGVFEGIRVYNGRIFKEKEHIQRLFESAKAIRLDLPMSAEEISDAMQRTIEANGITGDGYIRLVVTRGVGLLGIAMTQTANPVVFVIAASITLYPKEVYERGLHCSISSVTRNYPNALSPRIKSLNYLNNILAKAEAKDAGADEAIMLNTYGRVAECTGDNIFIVRRGEVQTPPASEGILEGITRGLVMELAVKRGIPVAEKNLTRHDLFIADECFATGTAAEIIAITEISKRTIGDGKAGPITRQLNEDFVAYRTSC